MKLNYKTLLTAMVTAVMIMAIMPVRVHAEERVELTETERYDVAERAGAYMEYSPSGVSINRSQSFYHEFTQAEIEFIDYGLEKMNDMIDADVAEVKGDQVIVCEDTPHPATRRLMAMKKTTGGGINHSEVKLWGIRRYNDRVNTESAAADLIKGANSFSGINKIPSKVLNLIGLTPSTIGTVASVLGTAQSVSSWMSKAGKALRKQNNKYGTILDIGWDASYKVKKQTASTHWLKIYREGI